MQSKHFLIPFVLFSAISSAKAQQSFSAVGPVKTVTVTLERAGTIGSIGVRAADSYSAKIYSFMPGGTCAVGQTYLEGATCTVKYRGLFAGPDSLNGLVSLRERSGKQLGGYPLGVLADLKRENTAVQVPFVFRPQNSPSTGTLTEATLVNFTGQGGATPGSESNALLGNDFGRTTLQLGDGLLYGATPDGGALQTSTATTTRRSAGEIFRVSPAGSGFGLFYDFVAINPYYYNDDPSTNEIGYVAQANDPYYPRSVFQSTDGGLYGIASGSAQAYNQGTVVYKLDSYSNPSVVLSGGTNGDTLSFVLQGADGYLYGGMQQGGANSTGTFFKVLPDGTNYSVFATNTYGGGSYGTGPMVEGVPGTFFGFDGDSGGYGSLYKLTSAGALTDIYNFSGNDGEPGQGLYAAPVMGADGFLYGVSYLGGASGYGAVFKIDQNGQNYKKLHDFGSVAGDGRYPYSALTLGSDGFMYGTTLGGGTNSLGTIYKISPNGDTTLYTVLSSFLGGSVDGGYPSAALVQGNDGSFYGAAYSGGASGYGTLYKVPMTGLTGPIIMTAPASVVAGGTFNITYTVTNAYSATLKLCYASNTLADAGWLGAKSGSPTLTTLTATAPASPGTYRYGLTCGGFESGYVDLTVTSPPGTSTQTITFPQPIASGSVQFPMTLRATASSGLPVTYTIANGPATVSGSTVTFTGLGNVAITATQAGNAQFTAAAPVTISIPVTQFGGVVLVNASGYTQSFQPVSQQTTAPMGEGPSNSASTTGGVAVDGHGGVWSVIAGSNALQYAYQGSTTQGSTTISYFASTNSFTGGGLNQPSALSVDGAGIVWVANYGNSTVSEFSTTGTALSGSGFSSGASGSLSQNIQNPKAIAVDNSGGVWVGNAQGVTHIFGAATPVVTPLSVGQQQGTLGAKP